MIKYKTKKSYRDLAKQIALDDLFSFDGQEKSLIHFTETDIYIARSSDRSEDECYRINHGVRDIHVTSTKTMDIQNELVLGKIILGFSKKTEDIEDEAGKIVIEKKSYDDKIVEIRFDGDVIYNDEYPYPIRLEKWAKRKERASRKRERKLKKQKKA